jgi:hypothetical protein
MGELVRLLEWRHEEGEQQHRCADVNKEDRLVEIYRGKSSWEPAQGAGAIG